MTLLAVGLWLKPAEGRETQAVVDAYFSPEGGAMKAVSEEIRGARRTLDVALYMITAPRLAWDLVSARKRGVKVRVILDSRQVRKWSQFDTLDENGVPVWRLYLEKDRSDPSPPQFHHKFAVVDGQTVITGSYNWTVMADERNHENLLVIRSRPLAARYAAAFEKALALAKKGEKEGEEKE